MSTATPAPENAPNAAPPEAPTTPETMAHSRLALRFSRYVDNHINPIVIKELRQAVRSSVIQSILGLFLTVQVGTLALYLLFSDDLSNHSGDGREVFIVLQTVLVTTVILLVPLYVGVRFAAERTGANVDLLFISTLKPRQIIGGKLLSGVIVAMLVGSVCAPFMTLTYLLRGIDLPTIFLILALNVLLAITAIQIAIFTSSLRMGPIVMGLSSIISLTALIPLFVLGIAMPYNLIRHGGGSSVTSRDFLIGSGLVTLGMLGGVGLLFTLSVAAITAPAANRAFAPRHYITGLWAVTLGAVFAAGADPSFGHTDDLLRVWTGLSVVLFSIALIVSCGERDSLGPRLRRDIPRTLTSRAAAFLFFSGSAGGIIWSALMIAASLLIFFAYTLTISSTVSPYHDDERFLAGFSEFSLLILAYVMTAILLRWKLFRDFSPTHATPTLVIALIAAGCFVPMLAYYFFFGQGSLDRERDWLLVNPFTTLIQIDEPRMSLGAKRLVAISIWLLIMSIPGCFWVLEQWRHFVRHELTPADKRREQLRKMNFSPAVIVPPPAPSATEESQPPAK